MFCRNCGQQTDETKSGICESCGLPLGEGIYSPPTGYAYDKGSGLYYQSNSGLDSKTGEPVRYVVWFDANSGEYNTVVYPQEITPEVAEVVENPMPIETPKPAEAPPEPILQPLQPPVDFILDMATGLYYRANKTTDSWAVTWFDPQRNSYIQENYPIKIASSSLQNTQSSSGQSKQKNTRKPRGKSRVGVLILAIVVILGGGATLWYFGALDNILPDFMETEPVSNSISDDTSDISDISDASTSDTSEPISSSEVNPPKNSSTSSSSTSSSTSSSSTSQNSDFKTIPAPEGLEVVVFPISPKQALFRISEINLDTTYPAKFDDMPDNSLIYEWVVRFDKYRAGIKVFNYDKQDRDTYSVMDFSPNIWHDTGEFLEPLPNGNIQMALDSETTEMLIILPDDVDFDFTKENTYSFTHFYHKERYVIAECKVATSEEYRIAQMTNVFLFRNLPDIE